MISCDSLFYASGGEEGKGYFDRLTRLVKDNPIVKGGSKLFFKIVLDVAR